jgi:hypothetical protein
VREALLRIGDQLCSELKATGHADSAAQPLPPQCFDGMGNLSSEDELLVRSIRGSLEQMIFDLHASFPGNPPPRVWNALDGAELVLRGELALGHLEEILPLLPSFVFLIASPMVEQDRALELSRRTSELVEDAQEGFSDHA